MGPVPDEFIWFPSTNRDSEDEDVVEEIRHIPDISNEPPESSADTGHESSSEDESNEKPQPGLRETRWIRKAVPRSIGPRTDIYYFDAENKAQRLRSPREVIEYCRKNNIVFKPDLFDFKGANTYEGIVTSPVGSKPSAEICQSQA